MQRQIALRGVGIVCVWLLGCSSVQSFNHSDGGLDAGAVDGDVGADSTSPVGDATSPTDGGDASDAPVSSPSDASDSGATDGGEGGVCAEGGVFCDGFENGFANWSSNYQSGGMITTDSTHVYRGSYALHAHVDAIVDAGGTAGALVQRFQTWPAHLFARFFAYQPSPSVPSPANYADIDGLNSPYPGIALSTAPPGNLAMNTFNTGQDQMWASDAGAIPLDQWVCFEIEVDTGAETLNLYMNGVQITDLSRGFLGLPQLGNLGVGLTFTLPNVQPAQDAWIDEVEVSASRIGCAD